MNQKALKRKDNMLYPYKVLKKNSCSEGKGHPSFYVADSP
jgi:hypothetical protein